MLDLATRLRRQADQCGRMGSPLTAALLHGAARDLVSGGVVAQVLAGEEGRPSGDVPALRLAGALHRFVLQGRAPGLASYYPSVGGTSAPEAVWSAAEPTLREHLPELREQVRRPLQTNEVGRSAVLYGALMVLTARFGLPIRLLEVGASAGLNLRPDAYAYEVREGLVLGDQTSRVRISLPWAGTYPREGRPLVVQRAGCDLLPIDPTSAEGRLALTSYVWADQLDRLRRLRAALELASLQPLVVEATGASAFLARELAATRPGVLTVVWQSVVQQYLRPEERAAVGGLLRAAGASASPATPLAWVAMEPAHVGRGGARFQVTATTWPDGTVETLAGCEGHGPPVIWRPRPDDNVEAWQGT